MGNERQPAPQRESVSYTARHRHHLPGGGYTGWSEGLANRRHSHPTESVEQHGYVEDSVGSPVHRHAWNHRTLKRAVHSYTSGPLLERQLAPAISWLSRVLRR